MRVRGVNGRRSPDTSMMRDWLADRYPTVAQALVGYPWAIERSASPEAYDNVFHLPDVEPAAILAAVGVRVEP